MPDQPDVQAALDEENQLLAQAQAAHKDQRLIALNVECRRLRARVAELEAAQADDEATDTD